MVFISLNMPLEDFLKMDKETRFSKLDWLLFDNHIKDRSLKDKNDLLGHGNHGNLGTYMSRIFYYPFYYKDPLHLYLIKDKKFKEIDFLPEDGEGTASIWNMKKVPESYDETKYPRVPEKERIWKCDTYEESQKFLRNIFEKLVDNKDEISHVCVGEKS